MKKNKIVIAPNPYRDEDLKFTKELAKVLEQDGHEVVIFSVFSENFSEKDCASLESATEGAAMVIPVGGDGTLIHVARRICKFSVPLLGVNMGTKGFISSLEPDEIELIKTAAAGKYRESRRMLLDVELIRDGEVISCDTAINDAVIKSDISCIGISAFSDDVLISSFAGDGVIVATPTGTTAYSMSAGGPLVEPEAENITLTPICAHAMASPSFVLSPFRTIKILPERLNSRNAFLSVDGTDCVTLRRGDKISIKRSETSLLIAAVGDRTFYNNVIEKLAH